MIIFKDLSRNSAFFRTKVKPYLSPTKLLIPPPPHLDDTTTITAVGWREKSVEIRGRLSQYSRTYVLYQGVGCGVRWMYLIALGVKWYSKNIDILSIIFNIYVILSGEETVYFCYTIVKWLRHILPSKEKALYPYQDLSWSVMYKTFLQ